MIYALILAGGKGTRMKNADIPKQFLNLGDKPIILHTIEKFLLIDDIDMLIIASPKEWITYTKNLIYKEGIQSDKIVIIEGGETRHKTIINGLKHIKENRDITDDDIIITHDAVRPFVSFRVIKENINNCLKYNAVDTVIPAYDTIVRSLDGEKIFDIPMRSEMYLGQTPQTFKINLLYNCYMNIPKEVLDNATDAAKIVLANNIDVNIVIGDITNIKITTSSDLIIANAILNEGIKK